MAISRKEIEHIASLARLDSTGGIFDRLADDMQGIVGMVDKLAELDLGDITDVIDTERKKRVPRGRGHSGIHPRTSSLSPTRRTFKRAA